MVKMQPLFLHLYGVKDVSQHWRLCIFRCVASAAHFFICKDDSIMSNFIEDLYHGKIEPRLGCYQQNSRSAELLLDISKKSHQLAAHLSEEDRTLVQEILNEKNESTCISNLNHFVAGFQLGARFTHDTFFKTDIPWSEILRDNDQK